MINTQAIALKMVLANTDKSIELFARLHADFFNDAFRSIFNSITKFSTKYGRLPSIEGLILENSRNLKLYQALTVLHNTIIPDVDIDLVMNTLHAEYTQDLFLQLLEKEVLSDITVLDRDGLLDRIESVLFNLESGITTRSGIYDANQISIFEEKDSTNLTLIPLGLCNEFDAYS